MTHSADVQATDSKGKGLNGGLSAPLLSYPEDSEESGSTVHEEGYPSFMDSSEDRTSAEPDLERTARAVRRYLSFGFAILSCLCAGSITAFSLYGHLFLSRLHYSQLQVNNVSIAAELSMYLPVPLFGYLCDRYSPGLISLFSSFLFGAGYLLAALTYRNGPPVAVGGHGWPTAVMVLAFVGVGAGTCSMYLAAVTTCAKNFGRGKHKGLALGLPIAAFGLGGMWQSQFGSRFLFEEDPQGGRGDVDVFKFFIFLSGLLFAVGLVGALGLQIVDEEELIDEAVEELERSGLLDNSDLFRSSPTAAGPNYGTLRDSNISSGDLEARREEAPGHPKATTRTGQVEKSKKTWLLNTETRRFLSDHTMWWLAAGFFLVTGPGEAFINNLGTIIGSLNSSPPPPLGDASRTGTTPATHISIVAVTSTLARIATGLLSDLLAPPPPSPLHHLSSSISSLRPPSSSSSSSSRFHISRITFLIIFALLLSLGQILLASGLAQDHPDRFWVVSALIGTGYGAVFSLVPISASVIWGVENFGTNWGFIAIVPAFGATLWGLVYSTLYQHFATTTTTTTTSPTTQDQQHPLCYGRACYANTFWAMAVSVWIACALWIWAWRGSPDGWSRRGIAV